MLLLPTPGSGQRKPKSVGQILWQCMMATNVLSWCKRLNGVEGFCRLVCREADFELELYGL